MPSDEEIKSEEDEILFSTTRRIVVSDELLESPREIRGRRLENPPEEVTVGPPKTRARKFPVIRRSYIFIGLAGSVLLIAVVVVIAVRGVKQRKSGSQATENKSEVSRNSRAADQSHELRRIEEDAKQVIRRISRDNRPYSFSDKSLREIESRVAELSRSPYLANALQQLKDRGEQVGIKAAKDGLQPALVLLVGLAITNGGEQGDCLKAAMDVLPRLVSLNKTFGSGEGDSCLILIAALREGTGTRRSHPLLKKMNRVVTNPLTERNVWYLNDQNVLAANSYALVIDTIAFGVITRSPRQFGLDHDPLNF